MKIALSVEMQNATGLAAAASAAREAGFDGIEMELPPDSMAADKPTVASALLSAGVPVACLSTAIAFGDHRLTDAASAKQAIDAIHFAATIQCDLVKIGPMPSARHQSQSSAALALSSWLAPIAHTAAAQKITLLIENGLAFQSARQLWTLLELAHDPAVAICWNLSTATAFGESPAIGIPVLNSRIRHIRMGHTQAFEALPVQNMFHRLAGIGYQGWVSLNEGAKANDALRTMRQWMRPPAHKPHKAVKK